MKEIQIAKSERKSLSYVVYSDCKCIDLVYREQGERDMWFVDPTFETVEYWIKDVENDEL
jgi:hypothetical protein